MTNDIGENFLLYGTAKEIWDAAKETYSNNENTSELFEVESVLHDFRQGELTVTQYFNTLNRYWQQLDLFEEHNWSCPGDRIRYRQIIERKRIYKFLIGLNKNLDEVRGRILGSKPLLNIREAFSEVQREESRKKIMMGSQDSVTNPESSALAVRGNPSNNNDHRPKKGRPWCDHCRRPGHTKDTCWKIHGKPTDWKPSRFANDKEGRGNLVSMDEKPSPEPTPFSKEQIEVLQKLFSQSLPAPAPTVVGTGSLAQKGNFLGALNVKKEKLSPWIIDSGASDHMTGDEKLFSTYNPCYKNLTVRIADGSLSKVAGTGSVRVSKNITLDSVLDSRKTIGNAKMCSGLYLLKVNDPSQGATHHSDCTVSNSPISLSVSQSNNDSAIMLRHYSDVWGPSRIKNVTGSLWFISFIDDHTRLT
ncbi:hypothetical protein CK203_016941 [Vitis vinifera]|uniref:Retrovirus-related Pol polyprotein from transposon TNT 1-94-like beta-barrel domain-containing protein n=1 Tax=Vitis vinifera TaxID=29760 RepID=A0A438JNW9_VITVI|nr:hypothetical protein CK203_016941 [Vitis vinifera]